MSKEHERRILRTKKLMHALRWSNRERKRPLETKASSQVSTSRRLACEAGIIPVVLGGTSQVLDVDRKARFHPGTHRVAMGLRDGGCTTVGCDRPPGMCHAHHNVPWRKAGGTSVNNGRLLCPRHHSYAHDPTSEMNDAGNDKVRFHRRT